MPIIRGHHSFDDKFTQIPNDWLRDERLSLGAIGLLAQILSHAPGWEISLESLGRANNVGRDAIRTLINELMAAGYLSRSEERNRNAAGHLTSYSYTTKDPETTGVSPTLAEPTLAEPTLVNPQHKKNIVKEEQSKEEHKTFSVLFEKFWAEYPRKVDRGAALKAFAKALKHASFEEILTGAIGYSNDPNRKPEFTKYPASWLNAQSWLNQVTVSDELPKRSQRERERTQAIIAETREAEAKSAPPPKCPHGDNVALCKKCFR